MKLVILFGILLCGVALQTLAASRQNTSLTMQQALTMASAAIESCQGKGFAVTATVVDTSGNVIASVRADGAGPHTVNASRRKAYTSASTKASTAALLATSQTNPAAQNLGQIDDFLLLPGGLPVTLNGQPAGAIGVGGAPAGATDEQCAQAGIDKLTQ